MKKTFTLLALAISGFGFLQAQNLPKLHPLAPEPVALAGTRDQHTNSTARGSNPTAQYSTDIIIENAPLVDQRRVRISVAFNGWLYAAYNTLDSATGNGGITIRTSRDNGVTWTTMDSYSVSGVNYPAFDIVVAGTDTNSLVLYNVGVNHNTSSGNYVLFVDRYDGRTGAFNGSNYNLQNGTRPIYDVALASDYRFPGVNASPYSVGLLYSTYSSTYDSIVFLGSIDGGGTWGVRQSVATTGGYNRGVSLAYGRSASASNGRYFAAWEQLGASNALTGHIYTSHSTSTVDGSWNTPTNLDSVSSTMINVCRHPQIAVQFNNTDNDSSSCTAVVLVERDYSGVGTDFDLLGFYNKRAHYTNYWNRLDIVNTAENDLQPDISYDPANNNFLAVYYDSTNSKLPYLVNNFNLVTPSTWTVINPQYNDVTTNLHAAWPRVEINPVVVQTAHAWIAEGVASRGVAMFDAEYSTVSVNNLAPENGHTNMYPNPASSDFTVNYEQTSAVPVVIRVYNSVGAVVEVRNATNFVHGIGNEKFDVSSWANGIYTVTVDNNGNLSSSRIVVAH